MPDLPGLPEMNEESKLFRNQSELEKGSFTLTLSVVCLILGVETTPRSERDAAGLI